MLNIEGKENFIIRNSLFDLPAMQARRGGRVSDIQNRENCRTPGFLLLA
jgi:hypothetical protein